ncbi:hypothetical protein O181_006794 [Austropuccinia psidii MF-1]|uniref:Reverse transcriptase Ty1/copia-type domain-containing protein n=1 Tax=Austropuccinia psidii MF-1 TaxID=1389203 RepID=A0A9Q3GH85_9BASI|nr:hypothetical protein [Austropuccinia psidii MF-1]
MPHGMLVVENVYYCQAIRSTILSLGRLIEDGFHPLFTGTCLWLLSKNTVLFNTCYIRHYWYLIRIPHAANAISKSPLHSTQAWHERLGHASTRVMHEFLTSHLKLGEVPTDAIAKKECAVMSTLHQPSNLLIPKTIRTAFASDYKSEWRLAAEDKNPGVDFFDLYAPTASMNSLQLLVAMKVWYAMSLAGFDKWSAYLYSPNEEDVYVQAPVGLWPEWNGKVMKLKKALHGTKQAARCWWKFSLGIMCKLGFEVSKVEPALYMLQRGNEWLIVWIHVDDGIVVGSSNVIIQQFKTALSGKLEVRWSDDVSKIVGLRLTCEDPRLRLNQHFLADQIVSAYQRPVVHKFNQLPDEMLTSNNSDAINTGVFRSAIGSLMYLSNGTRPDISYTVHLLAWFASNPGLCHWRALDHLIGYLSRHPHLSLNYGNTGEGFELWADANWGGEHQESTSGYIIKVFGNVLAWGSKRQTVVAMSICAAEYAALSEGAQLLSLLRLVSEPILGTQPLSIYCDNRAAILIVDDNLSRNKVP